ncbi:MAG: nicotinamide mononucleotide transporter [Erysipelotrichaceae bacterium]|nr:nicotinamide mononucleotide transporter [Erysipelotrichaceae bacterium]
MKKISEYLEKNRTVRKLESVVLLFLVVCSLFSFVKGFVRVNADVHEAQYQGTLIMERDRSLEDYDEDSSVCDVTFRSGGMTMVVSYPYEEYENLTGDTIEAYQFICQDGTMLFFDHPQPSGPEIGNAYRQVKANQTSGLFSLASSLGILALSLAVILLFGGFFSTYEKIWFMSIMVLATVFSVIFPESTVNGVNGIVIMLLYLLDTFLNILCELLISKQSRYNFLVSVLVEITEIVICIVLMYRFATMVTTLFFWLPIDILSFINWTRHKDEQEDELTAVRRLKGWQEALIILAIVAWTVIVGYLLSGLDITTDFYDSERLETAVTYIDACASAVGVANGLFIFFRLREQWIAWYICALLESVINILSGQYVLLILKLGYFTNTTYGYIKWSRYIRSHGDEKGSLF